MNWIVLTAFSDTLCPNNSNFHFRQRRFFPSYTSRSHSYRHTDVSHVHTIPVDIIIIHNCTFGLFVYFSRLCCDSVTFLSSLFTNRPTKKNNKNKNENYKWNEKEKHTHFVSICLSNSGSKLATLVCSFWNIFNSLSFFRRQFSDCFSFYYSHERKKEIHEKSSIIHLKCLKIP